MQSRTVVTWVAVGVMTLGVAANGFASAFGTLGNFDVVNETGHECHGFEIELEDMHSSDVSYTFGGSYSRYGSPQVVEDFSDPAHPRVIVRYQKWNGSQWEATPVAPAAITPSGHDCFQGGSVGNYLSSGCEHYGVSLRANPTLTTYRWLVAADPGDVNSAFTVAPEAVKLPVPVWSVGVGANGGVAVRADVEPLEVEAVERFGEPQWLRVWKVESDLDLQPEDLNLLLLGLADGIVPQDDTEIETEWKIIQAIPPGEPGEDADIREEELAPGNQAVVRRYEFYAYTGPLDPETNEVMPCIADDSPVPDAEPVDGCSDLGEFVGAQNAAIDVQGIGDPVDRCPDDPNKIDPGICGCGVADDDSDGDGTADCLDLCPADAAKVDPGACGCGVEDADTNANGVADCLEPERADMSIEVQQRTRTPKAGRRLKYKVRATNLGPDSVPEATLAVAVSGGPFSDLRLSRGCEGDAAGIVCTMRGMRAGGRAGKTISLRPEAGTTISVSASVSSPVVDPEPGNNAASAVTEVP